MTRDTQHKSHSASLGCAPLEELLLGPSIIMETSPMHWPTPAVLAVARLDVDREDFLGSIGCQTVDETTFSQLRLSCTWTLFSRHPRPRSPPCSCIWRRFAHEAYCAAIHRNLPSESAVLTEIEASAFDLRCIGDPAFELLVNLTSCCMSS